MEQLNNKNEMTGRKIGRNVFISVLVQAVVTTVSLVLNLFVPKYTSELTYSFYQQFYLFSSYVGIFHFGILDGVLIRYSGIDYEDLNKKRLRTQFYFLLGLLTILGIGAGFVGTFLIKGEKGLICAFVGISILVKNVSTYISYTFQITNRIKEYAIQIITYKALFLISIIVLLIIRVDNFIYYCLADVFSELLATIIFIFADKELVFGDTESKDELLKETKTNLKVGYKILLSTFSSLLLAGAGKIVINLRWGDLAFGKVSLAFAITNMVCTFVIAASVVFFPALKKLKEEKLPDLYNRIRLFLSPVLFLLLLLYFPGYLLLEYWLPKYSESLTYIGLLLPLIVFSSRITLLTNTYLKAYRKEKVLLIINLFAIGLAIALYFVGAYVFNSLISILIVEEIITVIISIVSESFISKIISKNYLKDIVAEIILSATFICLNVFAPFNVSFFFYLGVYVIFILSFSLIHKGELKKYFALKVK